MTVLLVRHAVAKARDRWEDDDELRPLTSRGRAQAEALVEQLGDSYRITRVLSSPSLRCVQTVEPLVGAVGLDAVEVERALGEGNGRLALALVERLLAEEGRDDVVLCSHGDVIPEVLDALGHAVPRCAKGSTWILDPAGATYLPAPD